jgi:ubiquinone/menaquinone biosynthesis C-methylase UbiE
MSADQAQICSVPKVEPLLSSHQGVKAAAVCRHTDDIPQHITAFIQPDVHYLDDILGRKNAEARQLRVWRKTYDLSQFAKDATASPVGLNTRGWNSSYTREPLPIEDMREWIETTVARVQALEPTNVLEIGCGTGLLLLRIAPLSKRYVGLDFSPAVIARLQEQLAQTSALTDRVQLGEGYADDLEQFAEDSFDTVIINSVAQYFPNLSYFERVLRGAIRLVRPGGSIFAGDLRTLPLLNAFALSVEACIASSTMPARDLSECVRMRLRNEPELVVSPSFFLSLATRNPKVSRVDIHPRRGIRNNEMTRFRYDAILRIAAPSSAATHIEFRDSAEGQWTLDNLRSHLSSARPDTLGVARIRNSRVAQDVRLLARLKNAPPHSLLGALRDDPPRAESQEIHPEALANLATETGYELALSWASCYSDGSYDAAFLRQNPSAPDRKVLPSIPWPHPTPADFVFLANAPGQAEVRENFISELAAHCRAHLPAELIPQTFRLVDSLPSEEGGTVDYRALLAAARTQI